MFNKKDYSKMTLEELFSEEKKMNSMKIPTALGIGFLVGVAVWSATHKGVFFTFILLGFALFFGARRSKMTKELPAPFIFQNFMGGTCNGWRACALGSGE